MHVFFVLYFIHYCLKPFWSLISLLYAIFICSILGFICNGANLFYLKLLIKYIFPAVIIFIIQIFFLFSIVVSSKLLYKYFKQKEKNLELTKESVISRNRYCCKFCIIFLINSVLSYFTLSTFWVEMAEQKHYKIQIFIFSVIVILSSDLICYFWLVLKNINSNNGCCEKGGICCCKKTNISPNIKNINHIVCNSHTNLNKNFIKSNNKVNDIIDFPPQVINYIDIPFILSTGEKFKIKVPAFITIEKLINFFFQNLNIDEKSRSNICFLFCGEKLKLNSQNLIRNEFKNNIPILVSDRNNLIHLLENTLIYN